MKSSRAHYEQHKEAAREFIHEKLNHWNAHYQHEYNRVSVRNNKTRWGSCSSDRNLNFDYKLLFLPEVLADYIIVHELCHLEQMNHSRHFWALVEQTHPHHRLLRRSLRQITLDMYRHRSRYIRA